MLKYSRHCLKPSLFQSLHLHLHASNLTKVFQHPFQILKQEKQSHSIRIFDTPGQRTLKQQRQTIQRQKFTFRTKNKEKQTPILEFLGRWKSSSIAWSEFANKCVFDR
ncbi:hypothetical protein CDAR_219331 [Caerostris darwini]|uniref:Ribosomal protein S10 n=1 Tax=Caerostris darwini TaxID=1538125 RepID=A0AAV4PKW4_9ARAC|nr:hypothetical protein CDAR_219331 [Caerostris darwini]